jgi:hypothetical protein
MVPAKRRTSLTGGAAGWAFGRAARGGAWLTRISCPLVSPHILRHCHLVALAAIFTAWCAVLLERRDEGCRVGRCLSASRVLLPAISDAASRILIGLYALADAACLAFMRCSRAGLHADVAGVYSSTTAPSSSPHPKGYILVSHIWLTYERHVSRVLTSHRRLENVVFAMWWTFAIGSVGT